LIIHESPNMIGGAQKRVVFPSSTGANFKLRRVLIGQTFVAICGGAQERIIRGTHG